MELNDQFPEHNGFHYGLTKGCNGSSKDGLSYNEWIESVQKERKKDFISNSIFSKPKDTANPPAYSGNEICHSGVEEYASQMTEIPSEDIHHIASETDQQNLFTPCMVGQLEAQLLKMMVQLSNTKRVLDIGTFTGMSAMAFAEGLPSDGEVVTLEFDHKIADVARKNFNTSSQARKITLKVGDAVALMEKMQEEGEKFDIVFLDAAKDQYTSYYKLAMDMLSKSGFILADNSLCALLYDENDPRRQALHDFNQMVKNDCRVEQLILTLREGVSIIRPKRN